MPFLLSIHKAKEEVGILDPHRHHIGYRKGVFRTVLTVYMPGRVSVAVMGRFINGIGREIVQISFHDQPKADARKALSFYQSPVDARQTIDEILEEMKLEDVDIRFEHPEEENKLRAECFQIFEGDGYFSRPLLIALFVQSFVHLDDWLWISYSTQIFENVGLSANRAQRASLLMSLPQAVISIALLGCFDNFSRRALLILPTIGSVLIGLMAILFTTFEKVLLRGIPIAVVLPVLAAFDLSAAAISGESAFAIVPRAVLQNDKILGTAIVGIAQV
ncbi:unnamed protein product, partial [Mesorhabditis belari]|uniref:Uncharacterized protein n=1 Tax=Mesorhabditis belari TaxID=2138241 RepID=A0AAF3FBK8_9BILA